MGKLQVPQKQQVTTSTSTSTSTISARQSLWHSAGSRPKTVLRAAMRRGVETLPDVQDATAENLGNHDCGKNIAMAC